MSSRTRDLIDISTLYPGAAIAKIPKWTDPLKERTLNWTRAQANTSMKMGKFKIVGVEPARTRGGKQSTSKANIHWSIDKAEDKWEADPSIIFIADVNPQEFVNAFESRYSDANGELQSDQVKMVPLWIGGPRAKVVENLVRQRILPKDADKAVLAENTNAWIENVAITQGNHATNQTYIDLIAAEEGREQKKTEERTIDVARINELIWLGKQITARGGASVHIYDINGEDIGRYGGKLSKNPNNIFTDWIMKKVSKGGLDFEKYAIDISKLSTEASGSTISRIDVPESANIEEGVYGGLTKRPVNVRITVTYDDDKKFVIPANSIWTSSVEPVELLFNEMKAVNNNTEGVVKYAFTGTADSAKRATAGLLEDVKKRGTSEKKTERQVAYDASALYD